jgi:hypothetical protein
VLAALKIRKCDSLQLMLLRNADDAGQVSPTLQDAALQASQLCLPLLTNTWSPLKILPAFVDV